MEQTDFFNGLLGTTSTIEALGTGSITLNGTGGDNGGSGTVNYGVGLLSSVTANGGNISITGTGGNSTGSTNYGISIQDNAAVSTTGNGTITISGNGGGIGASSNDSGVIVWNGGVAGPAISAANGSISITGPGGNGSGGSNYGFEVVGSGSAVETTGSGNITVTGSASNGNYGIDIAMADGIQTTGTGTITAITTNGSDFFLDNGATLSSNASGNAIVVAASGDFINDSGSDAPFITPNGRFIGYSFKAGDDTNPVTYQQQILGYTYSTLPPSQIVPANGYSGTYNTWVYATVPSLPQSSITPPPSSSGSTSTSSSGTSGSSTSTSTSTTSSGSMTTSSSGTSDTSTTGSTSTSSSGSMTTSSSGTSDTSTTSSTSTPSSGSTTTSSSGTSGSSTTSSTSTTSSGSSSTPSSGTAPTAPSVNTGTASLVIPDQNDLDSHIQPPAGIAIPNETGSEPIHPPYGSAASIAPAVPAPKEFAWLDDQLNKKSAALANGQEGEAVSAAAKETQKIIKHIVIPGVASVSAVSVGSVLLFSRAIYDTVAMLMGLGLGSQKLDPATLLDYWEREGRKRSKDDGEKNLEGMFG